MGNTVGDTVGDKEARSIDECHVRGCGVFVPGILDASDLFEGDLYLCSAGHQLRVVVEDSKARFVRCDK